MMKMKRWILLCGLLLTGFAAQAQVEKQVEVTKAYVPSLEAATKLPIEPDMTDTTTLRPEIDYTITPLSLQTSLQTKPIRPATVTYWEFNRPSPFYLKAGVGYPLQSVAELSVSTQNSGTGYALGYLHHEGRYGTIRNDYGLRNYATRMTNRVGGAAGLYLGKRILEGELSYRHRADCRHAMYYPKGALLPGDRIGYSDANLCLSIGDDFLNLDRLNVGLALDGALFADHSDPLQGVAPGGQLDLGATFRMARAWRGINFSLWADYHHLGGTQGLATTSEQLIGGGLRLGMKQGRVQMDLGADFYHDRVRGHHLATGAEAGNYILPQARLVWSLTRKALHPFAELNSRLETNDHRSLTEHNPYLLTAQWGTLPTIEYDLKAGLKGSFARDRFAYRLYATAAADLNHRYWVIPELYSLMPDRYFPGWTTLVQDELMAFGLGGELTYRPTSALNFELGAIYRLFEEDTPLPTGEAVWKGSFAMRYDHRKFRLGLRTELQSERSWAFVDSLDWRNVSAQFRAPFAVDLQLDFEWIYSSSMIFFVEGRNLLNQPIYRYPAYREYGINALAGVRMTF